MKVLVILAAVALLATVSKAKPTGKSQGMYTGPRLAVAAPSIGSYGAIALPAMNVLSPMTYVTQAPAPAPRPTAKSYTGNPPASLRVAVPAPQITYAVYAQPTPAPRPTVTAKSYTITRPAPVPVYQTYSIMAPSFSVSAPRHKSYSADYVPYRRPTTYAVPSQGTYGASTGPVIIGPQRISYMQATPITSTRYHIQDGYGQYSYGYAQSDGQAKTEVRGIDGTVAGRYSYVDPDGKHVIMSYVADKDGFRAAGNNLPKQPELPEELAREYQLAHTRLAIAKAKAAAEGYDDNDGQFDDDRHEAEKRKYSTDDDDDDDDAKPTAYVIGVLPAQAPAMTFAAVHGVKSIGTVPAPVVTPVQTYTAALPVQTTGGVYLTAATSGDKDGDEDGDGYDDGKYDHEKHEEEQQKYIKEAKDDGDDDDDDDDKDDAAKPATYVLGPLVQAPIAPVTNTHTYSASLPVQTVGGVYLTAAAATSGDKDGDEDGDGYDDGKYDHEKHEEEQQKYNKEAEGHDDDGDGDDDDKDGDAKPATYVLGTVSSPGVSGVTTNFQTQTYSASLPVHNVGGVQQLSAATYGTTVPVGVQLPSVSQLYTATGLGTTGLTSLTTSGHATGTTGVKSHLAPPQPQPSVPPHAKSAYVYTG